MRDLRIELNDNGSISLHARNMTPIEAIGALSFALDHIKHVQGPTVINAEYGYFITTLEQNHGLQQGVTGCAESVGSGHQAAQDAVQGERQDANGQAG